MDTKFDKLNISLPNQPPPTQSAKGTSFEQTSSASTATHSNLTSTDATASAEASTAKKSKTTNKPMITRDQYIDYDFSTIRDTNGGFLYDPKLDPQAQGSKFKDHAPTLIKQLPADIDGKSVPRCKVCQGLAIDPVFYQIFKLSVCDKCKREFPERFSLLTKTEVKEDYLLAEDELRDKDLFLSWSKPNPRKSTWNNMILYVREQVEEYAFKKWGGSEGLDAEFERREANKKKKKDVKFKAKLRELRKRTRTDEWQQQRSSKFNSSGAHEHLFEASKPHPDNSLKQIQTCSVCQLQVDVEEF